MKELLKKFRSSIEANYPKHKDCIFDALDFATKAHDGIKRKSGEPYIIHPISVSQILVDNNMDYSTVIAGLLHDVVEDTDITLKTIEKKFGKTVAKLVDGVTKIDSVTLKKENLTENDSLKRLLIAMGDDVRVIFIKLADRLHNMRTIGYLTEERQLAIAKETQELFIPIAERLGVRNLRTEMQSLTFACLHKDSFIKIKSEHDAEINRKMEYILGVNQKLKELFSKNNISVEISWWPEKYYSIYKKLRSQGVNKTYGLVLFKIIVPTTDDCYRALGIIHSVFKPVPLQIKDYIASPKPNGYQSLHSVVISDDQKVTFNVMIRTHEMNNVCEYGILALGSSKDSDEDFNSNFEKLNKLKEIISGEVGSATASTSFIDAVKTDLSANATWVFTPKMKPIKVDSSAPTAIDFAYAVHTKIGDCAMGAIINGKNASLGSILKSGDIVEIVMSDHDKAPSRDWLKVIKTYTARRRIREYFAKNLTQNNIVLGKKMLKNDLKQQNYALSDIERLFPKIKEDFMFLSLDDMFASVGYGGVKTSQIISYLTLEDEKNNSLIVSPVEVEGESFASSVLFSKCCCPVLGDDIVAVKSRNNVSIHTANCSNLKSVEKNKILRAKWKNGATGLFEVNLKIVAKDSVGFGARLLASISGLNVDMSRIFGKQKNGECEFEITLKTKNLDELMIITKQLSTVPGVKTINRTFY